MASEGRRRNERKKDGSGAVLLHALKGDIAYATEHDGKNHRMFA